MCKNSSCYVWLRWGSKVLAESSGHGMFFFPTVSLETLSTWKLCHDVARRQLFIPVPPPHTHIQRTGASLACLLPLEALSRNLSTQLVTGRVTATRSLLFFFGFQIASANRWQLSFGNACLLYSITFHVAPHLCSQPVSDALNDNCHPQAPHPLFCEKDYHTCLTKNATQNNWLGSWIVTWCPWRRCFVLY